MKQYKRILAAVLAGTMAVSLAACGGGTNGSSAAGASSGSAPAEAEGKITISYWTTNRHD